jgi:hypothetical protein
MGSAETDMLLDSLETKSFEDEADALAQLTTAALAINHQIEAATADGVRTEFLGDPGDKIRKWIRKLVAIVKRVATEWGAISYSIGVSLTGVSVSVEWAGPKA